MGPLPTSAERQNTYNRNPTKHIDVIALPPFLSTCVGNLLDRVQSPVIHDYGIQTAPFGNGCFDCLGTYGEIGEIACEDFYLVWVLGGELGECGLGAGYDDEFVGTGEEVVGYCCADTCAGGGLEYGREGLREMSGQCPCISYYRSRRHMRSEQLGIWHRRYRCRCG
jgi:hypothetical protein